MSLTTYSRFYFGHTVDETNFAIDFSEGGAELQATLNVGEYTLTEFFTELARAMTAAGSQTYTATVDRATRIGAVSAAAPFSLLIGTGSRAAIGAWVLAGFTGGADLTGANSYTGASASGSAYDPQFYIQDYIAPEDYEGAVSESVNESASGKIEVVTFGTRQFVQMNLQWSTDKNPTGNHKIKAQANAVSNLRTFLRYLTTKAPVEFMPDLNSPATFYKLILETTVSSKSGTGFRLKERTDAKAPGYFDTEKLLFRVKT